MELQPAVARMFHFLCSGPGFFIDSSTGYGPVRDLGRGWRMVPQLLPPLLLGYSAPFQNDSPLP